jgi:hypothetical protein
MDVMTTEPLNPIFSNSSLDLSLVTKVKDLHYNFLTSSNNCLSYLLTNFEFLKSKCQSFKIHWLDFIQTIHDTSTTFGNVRNWFFSQWVLVS